MGTVGTALMVPDNRPCGTPVASRDTGWNPLAFHKSYAAALSDPQKTFSFRKSSGCNIGVLEKNRTQPESVQNRTTYPLASRRASSCGRIFFAT